MGYETRQFAAKIETVEEDKMEALKGIAESCKKLNEIASKCREEMNKDTDLISRKAVDSAIANALVALEIYKAGGEVGNVDNVIEQLREAKK